MIRSRIKNLVVLLFFIFSFGAGLDMTGLKQGKLSFCPPLAAEEEDAGNGEENSEGEEKEEKEEKKDKKKEDGKEKKGKDKKKKGKKDKKKDKGKKDKKKDKGKSLSKNDNEYEFQGKKYQIANYVKDMMIKVPPGEFIMGSPVSEKGRNKDERRHKVKISKEFYIGKYEVTQDFYTAVMKKKKKFFPEHRGKNRPVDNITWREALEFCRELNKLAIAPAGYIFFLPTEAQWEYAARGGAAGAKNYTVYAGSNKIDEVAVYEENGGDYIKDTAEVGKMKPNSLGIYDMSGSVSEWCYDWYAPFPPTGKNAAVDPWGPRQKKYSPYTSKVIKGGSWGSPAVKCRIAARSGQAMIVNLKTGFRLVLISRNKKGKKK